MAEEKSKGRTADGLIKDFNPVDMPAFPPTEEEQARAIAWEKARKAGRLAELPWNWKQDGTLRSSPDER